MPFTHAGPEEGGRQEGGQGGRHQEEGKGGGGGRSPGELSGPGWSLSGDDALRRTLGMPLLNGQARMGQSHEACLVCRLSLYHLRPCGKWLRVCVRHCVPLHAPRSCTLSLFHRFTATLTVRPETGWLRASSGLAPGCVRAVPGLDTLCHPCGKWLRVCDGSAGRAAPQRAAPQEGQELRNCRSCRRCQ